MPHSHCILFAAKAPNNEDFVKRWLHIIGCCTWEFFIYIYSTCKFIFIVIILWFISLCKSIFSNNWTQKHFIWVQIFYMKYQPWLNYNLFFLIYRQRFFSGWKYSRLQVDDKVFKTKPILNIILKNWGVFLSLSLPNIHFQYHQFIKTWNQQR